jgi:threonine/homoserine/homoserine lactone efflux protein
MWNNIAKGIVVGLITGMPLGPIGAMCLKATLSKGSLYGLTSGLGAAIADSILAILAILGASLVSNFIFQNQIYFHFFGGIILIALGVFMFLDKQTKIEKEKEIDISNLLKVSLGTFLIGLINPSTIITFFAVFSSPTFSHFKVGFSAKALVVLGVFLGSMLWWFALIVGAAIFKEKMNLKRIRTVNKVISVLIILSGVYLFLIASSFSSFIGPTYLQKKLFRILLNIKARIPHYR